MGFYKRQIDMLALARSRDKARARRKRFALADRYCECCHGSDVPRPWVFECVHEELHMGVLDDVFGSVKRGEADTAATDDTMSGRFPTLIELMTSTVKVNGRRRQVSTLTILAEDGVFKVGLRDRDNAVSLWVSGDGVLGALEAIERALNERPVAWRKTPEQYSRGRQKS